MANDEGNDNNNNTLFTDEELGEMCGLKKGEGFVEVTCGCTSPRYGDAVGRLRVFACGKLEIDCQCFPGCLEDKLTPSAFEKHTGRETQRRWKYYVWVIVKGKKIPLLKTPLLKYHERVYGTSHRGNKGRPFHRDEFVRCSRCNKERRFRLQTQAECRTYHDALLDANWKCSDLPSDDKSSCDDEEERASRRSLRGCSRSAVCKGCTLCVCFGCDICRYRDCNCQTCSDFLSNAAN